MVPPFNMVHTDPNSLNQSASQDTIFTFAKPGPPRFFKQVFFVSFIKCLISSDLSIMLFLTSRVVSNSESELSALKKYLSFSINFTNMSTILAAMVASTFLSGVSTPDSGFFNNNVFIISFFLFFKKSKSKSNCLIPPISNTIMLDFSCFCLCSFSYSFIFAPNASSNCFKFLSKLSCNSLSFFLRLSISSFVFFMSSSLRVFSFSNSFSFSCNCFLTSVKLSCSVFTFALVSFAIKAFISDLLSCNICSDFFFSSSSSRIFFTPFATNFLVVSNVELTSCSCFTTDFSLSLLSEHSRLLLINSISNLLFSANSSESRSRNCSTLLFVSPSSCALFAFCRSREYPDVRSKSTFSGTTGPVLDNTLFPPLLSLVSCGEF